MITSKPFRQRRIYQPAKRPIWPYIRRLNARIDSVEYKTGVDNDERRKWGTQGALKMYQWGKRWRVHPSWEGQNSRTVEPPTPHPPPRGLEQLPRQAPIRTSHFFQTNASNKLSFTVTRLQAFSYTGHGRYTVSHYLYHVTFAPLQKIDTVENP